METVTKVCKYCGKEFAFPKARAALNPAYGNFCNARCRDDFNKLGRTERVSKNCKRCGKEFQTPVYLDRIGKALYCSYACKYPPKKIIICKHCGKEFQAKAKDERAYCSKQCAYKSEERSNKMRETMAKPESKAVYTVAMKIRNASDKWKQFWSTKRGAGNHNYKGGTYGNERHTDMGRKEYINWRNAVYQRDNYTCQDCGKKGGYLHAHHIKEWAKYPDLRHVVSNGVTLCVPCHKHRHFPK